MRTKGCDPIPICDAEARLALLRRGEVVAEQIRQAFAGVKLGKESDCRAQGIGRLRGQKDTRSLIGLKTRR